MPIILTPYYNIKNLIVAGNDQIWYEDLAMSAGTLVELTKVGISDIDCTDQLMMFEGFQKAFVVNGENLWVVDFRNLGFSTADISDFATVDKGTIIGVDDGAGAIDTDYNTYLIDFITAASGAGTIYATQISVGTSGEPGTGDNITDGATHNITLSANLIDAPNWYAWTPFQNSTSYGALPDKAYIGCLYRGRCVLAGNPQYPYQWYMSRQANPWDWAYTANDSQSPVAGSNADAGELGDIIRALISYKDDYLIFGCANSMWVMRGDPAAGGSLDEVSSTTGIFCSTSYCWGDAGTLYFWGNRGLCAMTPALESPQSLSENTLPNANKDWNLDPSLHRITMAYDRERGGIVICKTTLATGASEAMWYDTRSQGFFPEAYGSSYSAFSMVYYEANDPDDRGLLFGCADGYIRKFDEATKNDDNDVNSPIDSSYIVGPIRFSKSENLQSRIQSITITTAGGGAGGTISDTDALNYEIYIGSSAEEVLERIEASSFLSSGSVSVPGRVKRIRARSRGIYIAFKIYNSTASQTWGLEKISIEFTEAGGV